MKETICYTFSDFNTKYPMLLTEFLNDWEDNTESEFLKLQQKLYNECIENTTITEDRSILKFCYAEPKRNSIEEIHDKISEYVLIDEDYPTGNLLSQKEYRIRVKDIDLCDKYNRSFKKILELINSNIKEAEPQQNESLIINKSEENPNTLKWHGTQLEFTELIKPLFELKIIGAGLSQKETFKRLRLFFEIENFNENDKLKDIRNRTNIPTPFLNTIEKTLNNWIKNKD